MAEIPKTKLTIFAKASASLKQPGKTKSSVNPPTEHITMHIDIPEDLHNRLRHLAQDTGQDLDELLREAIEARLAIQERAATNLEGWTLGELRAAIDEGITSGPATPLDMDAVKRRARQEWEQSGRG
jgi:Arc/MetJ-type ribon-helix-helix transcriptional regulator